MTKRYRIELEVEGVMCPNTPSGVGHKCVLGKAGTLGEHHYLLPEDAKITEIKPSFEPGFFRSTVTKRVYYIAEIVDKFNADYQTYEVVGTTLREGHRLTTAALRQHYERIDHLA